jgi:hypothetical protein
MNKVKLVSVLVAALLLTIVAGIHIGPAVGSGAQSSLSNRWSVASGTTMFVVPDQLTVSENDTYIVNVRLNDVVNLAGWQFDLYWNRTILRCIKATVNTPVEWGGVALDLFNKTEADANNIDQNSELTAWQFGSGIDNNYSATYGKYSKAECFGPHGGLYHNTFNGSMSLVTLTFKATHSGITALTLEDTLLGDSSASPIDHNTWSDSQVLLHPRGTEAPLTPDKPVKDNNQAAQITNSAPPANSTLDNLTVTCLPATFPIEEFPVNLTLTPPIEAFPTSTVTTPC